MGGKGDGNTGAYGGQKIFRRIRSLTRAAKIGWLVHLDREARRGGGHVREALPPLHHDRDAGQWAIVGAGVGFEISEDISEVTIWPA